jgi:hypothetical protein
MNDMNVTSLHPYYSARLLQWQRCRDFFEGADALRKHDLACKGDAASAYLPRLSEKQSDGEYAAYVRRALYYNAPARTKDGLRGLVFSRDPQIVLPDGASAILEDADMRGTPLEEMLEEIVDELLEVGRYGVLVDYPRAGEFSSKLDEERSGLRPFMTGYQAEDILSWQTIQIGNMWTMGRVVVRELYTKADNTDAYLYRELFLEPLDPEVGGALVYKNRGWRDLNAVPDTGVPMMGGAPISEIPFYFYDPKGGRMKPEKPPLIDLIEVARSHYQTSADLEHASFACSVPTPYFLGFTEEEASDIALGGLNGIVSTNPEAKVGYLEYSGGGVEPLEKRLSAKADMMAKLGSRMLAEDKKDAEAAETLRIRNSGESATLADIARAVGRIMTQMLAFAVKWMGLSSADVSVELNTEYTPASASPQEITALLAAVQANKLPVTDFVRRLRKVGLIESDRKDEDIEAELEAADAKASEKAGALASGLGILQAARTAPGGEV